jgi:formiminotetrahydrofolate cyclodeaminase
MNDERLTDLAVSQFVAAVASAEQPVPAGGSVAALTAATSAALLALVCGVLRRHATDAALGQALADAERLQRSALDLVEADAVAFRVFLDAKRRGEDVSELVANMSRVPVQIAHACLDIADLGRTVEQRASGPVLADVRAARHLALAALQAALDIANENLALLTDPREREAFQDEITRLGVRQARPEKSG